MHKAGGMSAGLAQPAMHISSAAAAAFTWISLVLGKYTHLILRLTETVHLPLVKVTVPALPGTLVTAEPASNITLCCTCFLQSQGELLPVLYDAMLMLAQLCCNNMMLAQNPTSPCIYLQQKARWCILAMNASWMSSKSPFRSHE